MAGIWAVNAISIEKPGHTILMATSAALKVTGRLIKRLTWRSDPSRFSLLINAIDSTPNLDGPYPFIQSTEKPPFYPAQ